MTPAEAKTCCGGLIDQLRCERERQGLTQDEIMERGGPTANCQWEIERGNHSPGLATVVTYADALNYELRLVKRGPQSGGE